MDIVRTTWNSSPTITREKLRAVETLLEMFAQYLAECGQRLLLQEAGQQSPLLQKIEAQLAKPSDQALTVRELAERLHISPCYFCKLFRKQTGLTFTAYRTQLRIETAKRLLLDPTRRVSEAAYEFRVRFHSVFQSGVPPPCGLLAVGISGAPDGVNPSEGIGKPGVARHPPTCLSNRRSKRHDADETRFDFYWFSGP